MANPIHLASYKAMQLKRARCPRCGHKKPSSVGICAYCGKSARVSQPSAQPSSWWQRLSQLFRI